MSPVDRFQKEDGTVIELWSSPDALVLKAVAIVLTDLLKLGDISAVAMEVA